MNVLLEVNNALARANTVTSTKELEAQAQAARAWAKENDDYKMLVDATRLWILARRKTTALVKPYIRKGQNGREGNKDVAFLAEFGFTKSQWDRRCEELDIPDETIDDYFDFCISMPNHWEPSKFGLLRHANGGGTAGKDFVTRLCEMLVKVRDGEYSISQKKAARGLLTAFEVTG